MKLKSWSWNREFLKLKSWIYEVETVNYWSWKREFTKLNSWSWNREFVKLKSWIHEGLLPPPVPSYIQVMGMLHAIQRKLKGHQLLYVKIQVTLLTVSICHIFLHSIFCEPKCPVVRFIAVKMIIHVSCMTVWQYSLIYLACFLKEITTFNLINMPHRTKCKNYIWWNYIWCKSTDHEVDDIRCKYFTSYYGKYFMNQWNSETIDI